MICDTAAALLSNSQAQTHSSTVAAVLLGNVSPVPLKVLNKGRLSTSRPVAYVHLVQVISETK